MLVIGIGNEFRSDDAAGIEAARRIQERVPGIRVWWGEPMDLLELLGSDAETIVIDAVVGGGEPGTIHRIDVDNNPFPAYLRASSHNLDIADVIELARVLGRLPGGLRVYGIEAGTVAAGTEMTRAVSEAIETVVAEVCRA
ncbi:MAG: hydrogenase maturation protease [Acidimicrobiia bacterium]|nr:hydrogenase maturation protease [Acidimicrobiia bacterium]